MNTTLTLVPDDESGEQNTCAQSRPLGSGPGGPEFVVHPRLRSEGTWRTVLRAGARGAASLLGLGVRGTSSPRDCSEPEGNAETGASGAVEDHLDERRLLLGNERGAVTAEYAIVIMAAVAFAGLLVAIMRSSEIRAMLVQLVENALGVAG